MNHIITSPAVCLVGATSFDPRGMDQFICAEGLASVGDRGDTPLGVIHAAACGGDRKGHTEIMPEFAGRFCYGSWAKGRGNAEYIENILEMQHGSVLEHSTLNLTLTGISRSLTHELVRHRVGVAISQESQRYVDMSKVGFVMPPLMLHYLGGDTTCTEAQEWLAETQSSLAAYEKWQEWLTQMITDEVDAEMTYTSRDTRTKLITARKKRANEAARSQLPNACETKMLWTANLRTLRQFIMTRGADPADLEIRRLAVAIAEVCKDVAPAVFSDIEIIPGSFGVPMAVGRHWKV